MQPKVRPPFTALTARTVVLPTENIDTDQIIPARFLTTVGRDGLGAQVFYDWRYERDGTLKEDFKLNRPEAQGASILVAGRNFGCGSSREHAPWALLDFGIRVVISTEIADIFRGNALKNGLLPVVVDEESHGWLMENEGVELRINVEAATVTFPSGAELSFDIDPFAQHCLVNGIDELGFLLDNRDRIAAYEEVAA